MAKELTKVEKEPTAVIDNTLAAMYQDDAGAGFEDLEAKDYALPFLKILQGLSPEVQPGGEKFIDGAQQGDFVNSLTNEVFKGQKNGAIVIRVAQETKYIEWKPREAGGGLARISDTKEEAEANRIPAIGNPETDTEIQDTVQIYCLVQGADGEFSPVVLSWTKSKSKYARKWAAVAAQITTTSLGIPGPTKQMPIYGVVYKLTTRMEKNAKGTFYVPVVTPVSPVMSEELYAKAKVLRSAVVSGKVKAKIVKDDGDAAEEIPGASDDSPLPF